MNEALVSKTPKNNTKAMTWVCTWNNPTMNTKKFVEYLSGIEKMKYFCGQLEKGELETPHFQFYIEFEFARYFTTIKELLPKGTHIEERMGTKSQAREYCTKPESRIDEPFEWGEFIEQGKRSDLVKIIELINEGVPLQTIKKIYPSQCVMYSRQLKEHEQSIIQEQQEENFRELKINYIWGETGTGKTKFVIDKYGYKNVYRVKFYDQRAFDKYANQKVLVFDEFRSLFKVADMLHFLDGHPIDLPCRYNDRVACYTEVYIISNISLDKQYPNVQNDEPATWQALMRRIQNVYYFDNATDRQKLIAEEPNPNKLYKPISMQGKLIPTDDDDLPF